MIKVTNLLKKYGEDNKEVLSGIDFEVERGEFIAVLGGSGSGKTTLLRCLTLRESWSKGNFTYEGQDVFKLSWLQRKRLFRDWAFIEEKSRLSQTSTALKNVLAGRRHQTPLWRLLTGKVSFDEHLWAMDFLGKVGLLDKAENKLDQLSGGERQLVAVARALAQGAKVIVTDEPVSGLDPDSANRVMQDLRTVCERERVTIICSLYQVELAEKYASRIWGLSAGKLILDISGRRLTQREKDTIFLKTHHIFDFS